MYRAKVDDWRIRRKLADLIHSSLIEQSNRVDILQYCPLPFDDEFKEVETEDALEVYNRAVSAGYFEKPI